MKNARAKAAVSLFKTDAATKQALAGAEFGIFTKHDIYNVDGERIVDARTMLGTVTTGPEGKAVSDIDFPLMSEEYVAVTDSEETDGEEADKPEETATPETEPAVKLNSGDYFLKELSVSESYYLDDETEYPIHLEYQNQDTEGGSVW